jgi:hypothetical protein
MKNLHNAMSISIPRDFRLLECDREFSPGSTIKEKLLIGPVGLQNARDKNPLEYLSREEWLDPSNDVREIANHRKRKDMAQYPGLTLEIEQGTLLQLVRDMKAAGLLEYATL